MKHLIVKPSCDISFIAESSPMINSTEFTKLSGVTGNAVQWGWKNLAYQPVEIKGMNLYELLEDVVIWITTEKKIFDNWESLCTFLKIEIEPIVFVTSPSH